MPRTVDQPPRSCEAALGMDARGGPNAVDDGQEPGQEVVACGKETNEYTDRAYGQESLQVTDCQ